MGKVKQLSLGSVRIIAAPLLILPIFLLMMLVSQHASSAKYSYDCKIIDTYQVNDLGLLSPTNNSLLKNTTFHVDRKSGIVLGSINNSAYKYKSILLTTN